MNDTYTYKQILIGLRNEFLEAQRKLDELESSLIVLGGNSDEYYFNLYKALYTNCFPEMALEKKIKNTNRLLNMLRNMYGYRKPTRALVVKDNNGFYYLYRPYRFKKNDFNVVINPNSKVEFRELIEELLNSDFAKFMTFDHMITAINSTAIPRIEPKSFQFDLHTDKSHLSYLGRKDILEFSSVRRKTEKWEPLTQEHLDVVSKIEFPKDSFSKYHQTIIEKGMNDDKELVLDDEYIPSKHTKLKINEDGKKLVLSRIERRI